MTAVLGVLARRIRAEMRDDVPSLQPGLTRAAALIVELQSKEAHHPAEDNDEPVGHQSFVVELEPGKYLAHAGPNPGATETLTDAWLYRTHGGAADVMIRVARVVPGSKSRVRRVAVHLSLIEEGKPT